MDGNSWDRRLGEPIRWYARFELYRLLGSTRSLDGAFRADSGRDASHRAGASWRRNYRAWEWQPRAEEWDAVERDRLRAAEEERRRAARERRLYLLGEIRESSWSAILAANLYKLNELLPMLAADGTPVLNADGSPVMVSSAENVGVARQMLGTLRMMFFGALKGERLEMGEPTEIVADVDIVQFRADELAAAEQGVAQWREERKRQSG